MSQEVTSLEQYRISKKKVLAHKIVMEADRRAQKAYGWIDLKRRLLALNHAGVIKDPELYQLVLVELRPYTYRCFASA